MINVHGEEITPMGVCDFSHGTTRRQMKTIVINMINNNNNNSLVKKWLGDIVDIKAICDNEYFSHCKLVKYEMSADEQNIMLTFKRVDQDDT